MSDEDLQGDLDNVLEANKMLAAHCHRLQQQVTELIAELDTLRPLKGEGIGMGPVQLRLPFEES